MTGDRRKADWELSRAQVRRVDHLAVESLGIPSLLLMENAGRGVAEALLRRGVSIQSPVIVCCGKGNNGGDGLVVARHLEIYEIPVEAIIFDDPASFSPDARTALDILRRTDVPLHQFALPEDLPQLRNQLRRAGWIVDALLGTGFSGVVREPYAAAIEEINVAGAPVLAIDVPSGLDCDTGEVAGVCVRATATATLLARKPGFRVAAAQAWLGDVEVVEIGIPRSAVRGWLGLDHH